VKELDDEDYQYQAMQEPLYRVETGNYEYRCQCPSACLMSPPFTFARLVLRCRAEARKRFAARRSDVLVKLELLDNKHVQDIVHQLKRLMSNLTDFHNDCHKLFHGVKLFPIEVDLSRTAFQYESTEPVNREEEDEVEEAKEAGDVPSLLLEEPREGLLPGDDGSTEDLLGGLGQLQGLALSGDQPGGGGNLVDF
jgi:hypothetical protein